MSFSPLTFTGVSNFSEDFQAILDRAGKIAKLPIQSLQNQQADLIQQKLLLSNLSATVGSLATSVASLGTIGGQKALAASSSNTAKVIATNVGSPSAAVYNISDVTSVARAAAETSAGFASASTTPASTTGTVKLVVGTHQYTIDISSANDLTSLRNAINSLDAGVTASVLTTGTGANPYYLSITANTSGETTLQLIDDPAGAATNLLTANNQGADTVFKLNGIDVRKSTAIINDVVPGVTFQILGTTSGSESVAVTIASDSRQLSAALEDFVNNYNSVREQVNSQVGSNAGLLSGDFIVREIQSRLRTLTSYTGDSSIGGLADLGIEFDSAGVASFNQTAFSSLSSTQINDAFDFLGSTTSGFGGLASTLTDISDSALGLAKIQLDKYDEGEKRITAQISELNLRAVVMQQSLSAKLQAADILLAGLQSQQSMLDASIKSLNAAIYGTSNQ